MRLTAGVSRPLREEPPMAATGLEPRLHNVIHRAACLPYGLSLVQFGLPTCAADILGVSADTIALVRVALADEAVRPELVAEYEQTVRRREDDPEAFCRQCPVKERVPALGCPLALVKEAESRPAGIEALQSTSLEAAAVSFHVHPFVVLGARELLARRAGVSGDGGR